MGVLSPADFDSIETMALVKVNELELNSGRPGGREAGSGSAELFVVDVLRQVGGAMMDKYIYLFVKFCG